MHKLLEQKLVEKYPKLFKDYGGDMRQTCMAWGLACGKGWFLLLDELCSKLSKYDDVVAAQVKEKFGTLRFYINGTPPDKFDEIHAIINEFETKSGETCESCGQPGTRKGGSWVKTSCDSCDEKYDILEKIMGEGKYAYSFDEPGHIIIHDPVTKEQIFSSTVGEFMEIVSNRLSLIEDPMNVLNRPLWEQI
jgi:hypothetical protein